MTQATLGTIVGVVIVLLAVGILAWRIYGSMTGKRKASGCGYGGGCSSCPFAGGCDLDERHVDE